MDRYKMNLDLIIKNTSPSFSDLKNFFEVNKSDSFRYFDKRDFSVIENHKYTCLYRFNEDYIGYGHIDQEDGKDWLGIFISENYRGLGLGKMIMDDLISKSDVIHLTVDIDNINAINLYRKMEFQECKKENKYYLMVYKNKNKING
jgi:ribosomal protein S18 acetylase RimI-like enzyme